MSSYGRARPAALTSPRRAHASSRRRLFEHSTSGLRQARTTGHSKGLAAALCAVVAVVTLPAVGTPALASTRPPSASAVVARDGFHRHIRFGLGRAARGGAWRFAARPPARISVARGTARFFRLPRHSSAEAWLPGARSRNIDVTLTVNLPTESRRSTGLYLAAVARRQPDGQSYRGKLTFTRAGRARVEISSTGRHQTERIHTARTLPWTAHRYQRMRIEMRVTGVSPVNVAVRAWPANRRRPRWQTFWRDRRAGRIRRAGSVGLWGYRGRRANAFRLVGMTARAIRLSRARLPSGRQAAPTGNPTRVHPSPSPTLDAPSQPARPSPSPTPDASSQSSRPAPVPAPSPIASPPPPVPTAEPPASAPPTSSQPGPDNTGVPAGTLLRPHYGNLTLDKPGTYTNLDIHGFVYVTAPNVTLQNSIIRGGVATGDTALVTDVTGQGTNFVLRNSELVPEHPSVFIDGIAGWDYTAVGLNIHGTVDGAKIFGNNTSIRDSWIHDLVYYASDPNQNATGSHNDAVQILGGANLSLVHNTLEGGGNSAVQVTQSHGTVSNFSLRDNWLSRGACTVNLQDAPLSSMDGISIDHNRFAPDSRYNCAIIAFAGVSYDNRDNTWSNGTAPIATVRRV